ncbi:aldo/keto reductase [Frigidibacter oleivorans]|uniref:aldo/keto reductase n=1 Tax=Frigidibacter oleivorans TaxID=2487129 RepID=UPI000F8CFC57|nr:aldo/keto reductase [Frigidibacter oleivorans]
MTEQPVLQMNDGHRIPQLGLGVWQATDDQAEAAVAEALAAGYRHVDTATIYGNETGVGRGIAGSGLPRDAVFLTTKLWNADQGFDSALRACEASLKRLGTDYVDLYLIHWPMPRKGTFPDSWKALIRLREDGLVRSVGVSNFTPETLDRIVTDTGVTPVLNQVELHPAFQQRPLKAVHSRRDILTEAWSPLGQGKALATGAIAAIAAETGRTPAQVIIRWHLQQGHVAIPKSVTPARIRENAQVFDFDLTPAQMAAIEALDDPAGRIGPDPDGASF